MLYRRIRRFGEFRLFEALPDPECLEVLLLKFSVGFQAETPAAHRDLPPSRHSRTLRMSVPETCDVRRPQAARNPHE